jgi:hypothetical protein
MIMFALALAVSAPAGSDVYTCEYIASEADEPHTPARNDLLLVSNTADGIGKGSWTATWPGKTAVLADADTVQFGSVGGSVRLRWHDIDGKDRTAFISFSDMEVQDGSKAGWLSFDKPSLWQAPGYMCSTPPASQTKAAQ